MALAIAAAAVTVVSGISSFLGAKKAERAAKKQAELEAKHERMLTTEQLRQLGVEQRTAYGETLAGYVSGGVQATTPSLTSGGPPQPTVVNGTTIYGQSKQPPMTTPASGTVASVLQEQASEFAHERSITQQVGASKVTQGLARGKAIANQYRYQGYADAASSIAKAFGYWPR